jgi:deoxyribonuclease-4
MSLAGRRIGPHLPVKAGLVKAADRAHQIGATTMQLFTDNPTAWRRRTELPADLATFRDRLAELDIGPLAIHAPYLVNLAGADENFHQQSIATMVSELQVGAAYGASFVNVHVGSHRGLGREEGLRRLVDGISRIDEAVESGGPMLVLETSAGSGDGIGSSVEDLADAMELAAVRGVEHVGFCLDTAHLWAAGYCIDGEDGVARLVERIDTLLGLQRVVMVHLNDSRSACGSRVDRHEHIGAGNIGPSGMRAILEHPWLATLPTYLETPGMDDGYDAINLQRVALLLAGEQLPTLPNEAFAARPGRRMRRRPATTSAEVPPAT